MRKRISLSLSHSRSKYGPPPLKSLPVSPQVCFKLPRSSATLKKRCKQIRFTAPRQQSNAYLGMQVGELNMLKRLKKLDYLQNWSSKKSMFALVQQRTVSRLQGKLFQQRGCRSVF